MDDHITSRFVCSWICCDFTFTIFRTYYVDMSENRLQKVATSVTELIEEGADVKTIENIAYKFSRSTFKDYYCRRWQGNLFFTETRRVSHPYNG